MSTSPCTRLALDRGGCSIAYPLRIQGQGLLHAHEIEELDDTDHVAQEIGGGTVLANFP